MAKLHLLTLLTVLSASSLTHVQVAQAQRFFESTTTSVDKDDDETPLTFTNSLDHDAYVELVSSEAKSSWLPDWSMPWSKKTTSSKVSSYKKKEETTWDKFSKSSKRFWSNTAELLDPYPDPKPPAEKTKKSWTFGSWFKKDSSDDVQSVNDFLKQSRID